MQHRGQDSAGMVTADGDRFVEHRQRGMVRDVFVDTSTMDMLQGKSRAERGGSSSGCGFAAAEAG
eukprot:364810-Chlamydomonas_euryale.AAC.1